MVLYAFTNRLLPISEILKVMPTDDSISRIFQQFNKKNKVDYSIPRWGDGIVWDELHVSSEFITYWD